MADEMQPEVSIGGITMGESPCIVGTVASAAFLRSLRPAQLRCCDVVEVHLDRVGPVEDWLERCLAIEAAGTPTLLTVRLRSAGGDWTRPDEERREIFRQAARNLASVDVELTSTLIGVMAEEVRACGKTIIVSCHDLDKTPPLKELQALVTRAFAYGQIVKVATMIKREEDIVTLRRLLEETADRPICVIGLGRLGAPTRTAFPLLGSCLAYGYLDAAFTPGQLEVKHVFDHLKSALPHHFQHPRGRKAQPA